MSERLPLFDRDRLGPDDDPDPADYRCSESGCSEPGEYWSIDGEDVGCDRHWINMQD